MCALWAQGSVTYIFYFFIHIGYKPPTFGEYMSVEFIYWYWIYPANYWRIYVSWRVYAPIVQPEKVDSWAPDSLALWQKPSNLHISLDSWQDISNTSI